MLACGHVICAEALNRLSRNNPATRFKCPYCPNESNANQARQVFF